MCRWLLPRKFLQRLAQKSPEAVFAGLGVLVPLNYLNKARVYIQAIFAFLQSSEASYGITVISGIKVRLVSLYTEYYHLLIRPRPLGRRFDDFLMVAVRLLIDPVRNQLQNFRAVFLSTGGEQPV